MTKVFNLQNKYNFTKDVQKNVLLLKKLFGTKFKIKNKNLTINVKLIKESFKSNNMKYWSLLYDQSNRIHDLHPFKIDFYNIQNLQKRNITYIANIHNTDKISGSKMVLLVLDIQRKLKVNKTYLYDGASVRCGNEIMNLSELKMLEKSRTFYMKFGFKMNNSELWYLKNKNEKQQKQFFTNLINNIKKIKIKDLINDFTKIIDILCEVIKKNDYKKLKVQHMDIIGINSSEIYHYQKDPYVDIPKIFEDCYKNLNILHKTKEKSLYKYLIRLFNDNKRCSEYITLLNYLKQNKYNIISYKKKIIKRDYIQLFKLLEGAIQWGRSYSYTF